jgi:hypothetical protein
MTGALMGSALGKITFIDAELANTIIGDETPQLGVNYSTDYSNVTDNIWGWRTNRTDVSGAGVWVTDGGNATGVYDRESTVPLKVDVTLPLAGVLYDLYAIIMNNNTGAGYWDVATRIGQTGDFTNFNKNSAAMTRAVKADFDSNVNISTATSGDQTFKVRVGQYRTTAANEVVSIYINGLDSWGQANLDQRTRFDGVGYEVAPAYAVSPSNGETDVAVENVTLSWTGGYDPNAVGRYVYMGTSSNALVCLNAGARLAADAQTFSVGALSTDTTYYWRIETAVENGQGGYPAGDPNNIFSSVWSFTTIISVPVITGQPSRQVVSAGGTAQFTVAVESLSEATFKWYYSADNATNTPEDDTLVGTSQTLSLSGVTLANEGFYYCLVNNDSNTEVASLTASLAITRLVARWTFDQADYVGGRYLDKSGEGHPAEPNGVPAFIAGQVDDGISIACPSGGVPSTQSWASAGTWNPSELSGMFTVSFWVNWYGPNSGSYVTQNLICKGGQTGVYWRILSNGSGNLVLSSDAITLNSSGAFLEVGTWVYCTVTFDGSKAYFYKNGELISSGAFYLGNAGDGLLCLGGKLFDTSPQGWMNGALDEVRIYNFGLSDLEVARAYVADKPDGRACVSSLQPDAVYDINGDCIVNLGDFAMLAAAWLDCGLVPDCL